MMFVGRKEELGLLEGLRNKSTASLVVIYGRRRIGKSRLVEEFGRDSRMYTFTGLPPQPQMSQQSQLDEFSRQMARQFNGEPQTFSDWGDAFYDLSERTKTKPVIIFFDEISWLGNCDSDFLGKLKNAWDTQFKRNNQLILILCGSVSVWINKNILSNTGFYGRISLKLHIKELLLKDCNQFWPKQNHTLSAHDKLKILSVTGGIPKYLEEIKLNCSAEENIKQLCFLESGLLFSDFPYIFSALLQRESALYENILSTLSEKNLEQKQLSECLDVKSGGLLSSYLDELVVAGFIERDHTWQLKTGQVSRLSHYRLSDNYLRFYLKYIKPNSPKIHHGQFQNHSMSALPGWSSIMGLQLENLVLNNRKDIKERLGIYPDEVIYDNPYFQRKNMRHHGCQIDYMIQTKFGNLYLCEIKFSRNIIRMDVVDEVKAKIKNLALPKYFSIKPVLIHASDVHDDVIDSGFFVKIIDLASLLTE